ncbi:MAG: hypothetical protein H7Z73_05920, partial [Candidatus Saccharibacteria bacterium]|nr:hypothetical protein [Moraxellaceae bacterium]
MSNQNSNPMSQYSGLNAPLIFPEKSAVAPTAADILGKKTPVLPPVAQTPSVINVPPVVVPVIPASVVETPSVGKQSIQEPQASSSHVT